MHFYFDAAAVCSAPLASQIPLDFCAHQHGLSSLSLSTGIRPLLYISVGASS
jgi:hypothetical protein